MGKKLYVGNLPYSTDEQQLRDLFEEVGEITSVAIVTDRQTGRSRGFGFVEMETQEAADEAIERLHGYTLDDRDLVVNEARPPKNDNRGGGGGGGGYNRNNRGKSASCALF